MLVHSAYIFRSRWKGNGTRRQQVEKTQLFQLEFEERVKTGAALVMPRSDECRMLYNPCRLMALFCLSVFESILKCAEKIENGWCSCDLQ